MRSPSIRNEFVDLGKHGLLKMIACLLQSIDSPSAAFRSINAAPADQAWGEQATG
jgi:hypothetical protein